LDLRTLSSILGSPPDILFIGLWELGIVNFGCCGRLRHLLNEFGVALEWGSVLLWYGESFVRFNCLLASGFLDVFANEVGRFCHLRRLVLHILAVFLSERDVR